MAIKFTEWQVAQLELLADAWAHSNSSYCEAYVKGLFDKADSCFSGLNFEKVNQQIKEGRFGFPSHSAWAATNTNKTDWQLAVENTQYEVFFIGQDDEQEITAPIGDGGRYEDQDYEVVGIANGQKYALDIFNVFENGRPIDSVEFMETDFYIELCQAASRVWGGDKLFIED